MGWAWALALVYPIPVIRCFWFLELGGVVHALRECLREYHIPVTSLNPGNVAAEIAYEAGAEAAIQTYDGTRIPMQDLVLLLRCVRQLSRVACVKEIDIPAMPDRYV